MTQWVYDFAEGGREMRDLLGGKGANVAEMTRVLGPDRVPAGFTITTEACVSYMRDGAEPDGMQEQVGEALARLQESAGKTLGDAGDPLLVSVRSGARESMPGMLDTVLNLGLNDLSVEGLARATDNPRFAWDSYRRFVQMFGSVVRGIDEDDFDEVDGRDADDLRALVDRHKEVFRDATGEDFPQDPAEQLRQAIRAVFDSWQGERAVAYRRAEAIPDEWGTAVNVQQMVFGNKGETSGSGVAFSRDFATGAPGLSGDFLVDAQGEDVVSGNFSTLDIAEMADVLPEAHAQLVEQVRVLERHYLNMQDVEFTVEDGNLFFLQTRDAKRPPAASVRFACDAVDEGLLDVDAALLTFKAGDLEPLLHEQFDPSHKVAELGRGVGASPGAAKGAVVFSAADAVAADEPVILVRPKTRPVDYAGMAAAAGILTREGGHGSHAALVARGKGWPCVIGVSKMTIDLERGEFSLGGKTVRAGDQIAIDGSTGIVTLDDVPLVEPELGEHFARVLTWCDERRRLGVRANADVGEDARAAVELGAEGIGLCRTEHTLLTDEHKPKMAGMIMAADADERRERLEVLLPLQREVFAELFAAMGERPVTVRLLDPPLHEFLPDMADLAADVGHLEERLDVARIEVTDDLEDLEDDLAELRTLFKRVEEIHEENPMLGTRGCRLGILYPEIYEMQVDALLQARTEASDAVSLEIMVPLVDYEQELIEVRRLIDGVAERHGLKAGEDFAVGTMIELPRACFVANLLAEHAEFFSFGTNDLTQTALGFSRDDVESKFVPYYMERGWIDRSPFETIDKPGVGWLVRLAAWVGREARPGLKLGICGEHGGDPESIDFFHMAGLDYVSCSPFRIPIARVAAAQAALRHAADK
ncbi:MAG: pyruvate, phosphate dikinase [Solirubrobacteraceae bacterium]